MNFIRELLETIRELTSENTVLKKQNLFLLAEVSSLKKIVKTQKCKKLGSMVPLNSKNKVVSLVVRKEGTK